MTKNTLTRTAAAVLALGLSFGTAWAQSGSSGATGSGSGSGTTANTGGTTPMAQPGAGARNSPTGKSEQVSRDDRKFIEQAAGSGMFELQSAQLAATKATNPQVKEYASMLVDHHSKTNSELMQLANSKGVEVPAAPPRAMRNQIEQMGKKSGQEFDRDFIRNVGVQAHQKDVKLFEKASKDAKDPELKSWAAKTLPQLQQHLAMAQKMPQAGGKGGGNDAASMGNSGGNRGATTGGGAATGSGGASGANKSGT